MIFIACTILYMISEKLNIEYLEMVLIFHHSSDVLPSVMILQQMNRESGHYAYLTVFQI